MIKRILTLFLVCWMTAAIAQNNGPTVTSSHDRCGFIEANHWHDAGKRQQVAAFEKLLQAKMEERRIARANGRTQDVVYQIPVIIHIIHSGEPVGTGANITATQAWSQIQVLNEDFRNLSFDAANLRPEFQDLRGDAKVEFVLALEDPDGNLLAEPGIHRYETTGSGFQPGDFDAQIKPVTSWDPYRYANFWSASLRPGLLGYAQFPEGSTLPGMPTGDQDDVTDGVVMGHQFFGSIQIDPNADLDGQFNLGRTATHEVGHWLGLRHIWGDGPCGADDFVTDTPEADAPSSGCPSATDQSCGSVDLWENFMDYTADECMNMFTIEQVDRMRTAIEIAPMRNDLVNSDVPTQPVNQPSIIADFMYEKSEGSCPTSGVEVQFTNTSRIFFGGGEEISGYHWTFEGGTPASSTEANPTSSFPEGGPYDITLIVESAVGNDTLFVEDGIKITQPIPYWETVDERPVDWDYGNGWSFDNTGTGDSTGSLWINNFAAAYPNSDLSTLFFDVKDWDSLRVRFDVAYTYFSSAVTDSLRISVADCNGESDVWQKGGFQLATTSPKTTLFTPTASQWRTETLELSVEDVDFTKLIFTNLGDNGNALYLDNIYVEAYSPALNIELGDDVTVCNSTTLDPGFTGADSYSWTKAGDATVLGTSQTLTVTESGTYQVEVTAFGETKTDQVTVTVNFPSTASFTYSTSNDFLTVSFTNSSTNAESYEWNFGDGSAISTEEAPTHVYADYGSYTVTLTTKAACGDDTQSTLLTEVTALDVDNYLSSRMLVYPNPNEGSFVLDVKNMNFQQATIQVLDITGRRIFSEEVKSLSNHNINLRNIEAGIYFIRLDVDGKTGIQKVQIR